MARTVVQVAVIGLLLALVTTLPNKDDWDIYSFHINSTVSNRYATTVITSRVANRMDESKEIEFQVRIPKNAFISKFRMFIDGVAYDGIVKAKEAAQRQYHDAVSRGQSAGIVSSVGRTLEEFKTSVNVAAHKKVTFELTYEELLKRRLGKYELTIHARPMQPVKDFKVDVHINEKAGINFMEVKGGLNTNALANAVTKTLANTQAWVYFYPTVDQQKLCDSCGEHGMNGDLVIVYDINRDAAFGNIKKSPGYFVHHFAPSNLPRIPKNVVFVIDQSGSMHGRKMQQTRIALIHILNDLAKEDFFGLITFDSNIFHWKRELVQADEENLASAKAFAQRIQDRGATDINQAVLEGTRMLKAHPREGSASILILLTDGDPTSGVTNLEHIQSNVKKAIAGKFPLYCLGFGFDVNFEFLEKMSLQNNGAARRIYEDSDADLQLKGFYEEVATPLLTDVTMIYEGGFNVTQTNFSQYYNGSEIVVAGQITDNDVETFTPQVVAISRNTRLVFTESNGTVETTGTVSDSQIQRVWAYLTVKQLLEKELQLSGPEKDNAKKEALELSLKYSFVTPLTSMVVTKPPGESSDVLHKPKEGEIPQGSQAHVRHPPLMSLPGSGSSRSSIFFSSGGGLGAGFGGAGGGGVSPGVGAGLGAGGASASAADYVDLAYDLSYDLGMPAAEFLDVVDDTDTAFIIAATHGSPISTVTMEPTLAPPVTPRGGNFHRTIAAPPIFPPIVAHSPPRPPVLQLPTLPIPVLRFHMFLLKTADQSPPLCFGIFGDVRLQLLNHPNKGLSVNGELDSVSNRGFKRIVVHTAQQHFEVDTQGIVVRDGLRVSIHTQQDEHIVGQSVTVIRRSKEIDIVGEDTRIVILIHEKDNNQFLWPVLRQKPADTNVTGILALEPAVYEEVQQTPTTKLRIHNKDIDVTRSSVDDHSVPSVPTVDCWIVPAESALQRPINEFIVAQL